MIRVCCLVAALGVSGVSICWAQGTVPREEAPPPLSPTEAEKHFKVADELGIKLVVAEPDISQPLSISFDDRGRMWVLQYRQFPNPNGLKPVQVDNWLRTKYAELPAPPPKGPKGNDRISIYADRDGDGRAELVSHFLTDLNLASGMALGYGGVFVAQPPYLSFYPDRNRDDVPDGDPEVLLKGFGMNDAHAFANSLSWGPDGWLYGAQGSTATAELRGIGFQQGIWRYHPRTRVFELFAEGGGNTWGIDFDRDGNLFAGGNTVEPLVHHVQGAYYVKGFGKHGPLHNPHAYGYFQPVRHHGYVGDSLTGGFVLYQGGAFPKRFDGACIAPNTRHSACRWSTLAAHGSTFETTAAGDFITTDDIWFRPVDSTIGPDGALYVADWYDYNISHSSPKNRSKWYQPSRNDGRVWRIAPESVAPIRSKSFDLAGRSSAELVDLLTNDNIWYVRQALRLLAEREDASVVPELKKRLGSPDEVSALRALWAINASGGFDDRLGLELVDCPHPYVRAWTVRLLGDERSVSTSIQSRLVRLARDDSSVVVRSQLACSAKRISAISGMPIVAELLRHDEDADDVFLPLLLWWAIEDKAVSDRDVVLRLLEGASSWKLPLVRRFIIERLARRLAAEGKPATFAGCAWMLTKAPDDESTDLVVEGMVAALSGRKLDSPPKALRKPVEKLLAERPGDSAVIELALRTGVAERPALDYVGQTGHPLSKRVTLIRALGETRTAAAVDLFLQLVRDPGQRAVHEAVLSALGYFDAGRIADEVVAVYPQLGRDAQQRVIDLLAGRPQWIKRLLASVRIGTIDPKAVSLDQVRRMLEHHDRELNVAIEKIWGQVQPATPLEKQGRISAVVQSLGRRKGNPSRGLAIFEKTCATCHKLNGRGAEVGPDLTGAERKDRQKLVANIVDPSADVRPQFIAYVAATKDGRVLTGLLAESTENTITLLDAKSKRVVLNRNEVEELRESHVSLMPEKLLDELSDQQIRDLIAYIQSPVSAGK